MCISWPAFGVWVWYSLTIKIGTVHIIETVGVLGNRKTNQWEESKRTFCLQLGWVTIPLWSGTWKGASPGSALCALVSHKSCTHWSFLNKLVDNYMDYVVCLFTHGLRLNLYHLLEKSKSCRLAGLHSRGVSIYVGFSYREVLTILAQALGKLCWDSTSGSWHYL